MTHTITRSKYIETIIKTIIDLKSQANVVSKVILTPRGAYVIPVKERESKVVH